MVLVTYESAFEWRVYFSHPVPMQVNPSLPTPI